MIFDETISSSEKKEERKKGNVNNLTINIRIFIMVDIMIGMPNHRQCILF